MAAKPNIRFMSTKTGKVHVVTTKTRDDKESKCPVVKKGHAEGQWGRKQGVSPDAALAMDECIKCASHSAAQVAIEENKTPAQKRVEAKERAQETIRKVSDRSKSAKPKAKANGHQAKEPKRRGPKQSKPETMEGKAREHCEFAESQGWKATVEQTGSNEWAVEAIKGKEILRIVWQDGRTIHSRVTLSSGTEVRLRNSSNWRKHAAGQSKIKSDYQPRTRGGKRAEKRQVIDDDAPRKLPFTCDDDDDDIIKSLNGRQITWRVTMTNALDTAKVPIKSRNVRISLHPKSHRKMISFHELHAPETPERNEQLGPERTVYLDKILKVR